MFQNYSCNQKFIFGIGLSKNISNKYKILYEELKQFGKINRELEPDFVSMYFIDFGIGYEGALVYKNKNFQKGIKYLEKNKDKNTLIFGRFPIPDYLTKQQELEISNDYHDKNHDKQYMQRGLPIRNAQSLYLHI